MDNIKKTFIILVLIKYCLIFLDRVIKKIYPNGTEWGITYDHNLSSKSPFSFVAVIQPYISCPQIFYGQHVHEIITKSYCTIDRTYPNLSWWTSSIPRGTKNKNSRAPTRLVYLLCIRLGPICFFWTNRVCFMIKRAHLFRLHSIRS